MVNETLEDSQKEYTTPNICTEPLKTNQTIVERDPLTTEKQKLRNNNSATPSSNRKYRYKITNIINKLQHEIQQ